MINAIQTIKPKLEIAWEKNISNRDTAHCLYVAVTITIYVIKKYIMFQI